MKNRIDTSRQKTPWDKSENKTKTQDFISKVYKENYKNKHKKLIETHEEDFINSIKINQCCYCNSTEIVKRGFTSNGITEILLLFLSQNIYTSNKYYF